MRAPIVRTRMCDAVPKRRRIKGANLVSAEQKKFAPPHDSYSYNTTDHYAIERICSAQNVLFKTVLRAVRVAAFKSPNRSVKF